MKGQWIDNNRTSRKENNFLASNSNRFHVSLDSRRQSHIWASIRQIKEKKTMMLHDVKSSDYC